MAELSIEPISCLRDNYCYLITVAGSRDAWLVDPSEVEPPARVLEERGLTLQGILATHHHPDHVGGVEGLRARFGGDIWVAGHESDRGRIPAQTHFSDVPRGRFETTDVEIAGRRLLASHIPGHTRGAIAWALVGDDGEITDVFTGDTLFAAGCGRLFEGTPEQMLESLQTICSAGPSTRLWFGHEYTASNLRFAASVEPDNAEVRRRQTEIGACTTPTTVAEELATNPFVRASSVDELAARRKAKDTF